MSLELNHISSEEDVFIFPASFAQQRLWFIDQLVPGAAYSVPLVFRLHGTLDSAALEQSFDQIVQRHEVLRTTFDTVDGQLVQVISAQLKVSLRLITLQDLPEPIREQEALQRVRQEIQQPFNLVQGPLLRLTLLQLDQTDHVLLINLHHIIFDEWSSGVLIRELGTFYTALMNHETVTLPDLPIQYADFAHWQHEWLQGDVLYAQLDYWRSQLKNASLLNLPSRNLRPSQASHQGATRLLELPHSLLVALEDLSQQAGVTLFMTLLAAFQTLLYRYTGQDDIVVGSPIANRHHSQLEGLIGFFVNSLVLRTDLAGNPTFWELLDRVREVTLGAYAHQDLPFEKLVEELHPERNLHRNPLFQVVFALQNTPMEQLKLPGLTLHALKFETRTTRFDLELYLWKCSDNFRNLWGDGWQHSDGLRGVVVYNTDLFDAAMIDRFCQHFQILLEGIVAHPNRSISDLPILTPAECHQLLVDWNNTHTSYPADSTIHQLFEIQVRQTPAAIALQADQSFSYQKLNQGSNQLARYLQQLGVKPGDCVGFCLERSIEAVAVMLAILKTGAAYVPLDPSYPSERLCFMLEDAQVSVLLTHHEWADRFSGSHIQTVCVDQVWSAISEESDENLPDQSTADSLAYVIYTSGSTGIPKGVAVPHRSVIRLVRNTNYVQLTATDRIAQVANLAFDAATFEIWGALLNGARLVDIPRNITLNPQDFAAQLQQANISVLFLTTALFNQIAREAPTALRSLKYLLFGGEAVDPKWVREILQHGAPQHLLHVYGPTENTTFSSWYQVQEVADTATTIPIGRPISNTQIYLLDAHLNPVPVGVIGEIYLGGDGLAQGYLNRPELTDERFISTSWGSGECGVGNGEGNSHSCSLVPNSQPPTPSLSRLYKTGDLARYLPDGNLEFVGRIDDQVKLRGFRIELGEIEAVLSQHEAVREVAVVMQPIEDDRRLVAYVVLNQTVPHQTQASFSNDLRHWLKSRLPEYMVPSALVVLPALPLTPNGKLDRRSLPVPAVPEITAAEIAPRTSVEAVLVEIWCKLLGVQVGVYDNFFELGGHSLLATQLMSRIRTAFQVELPLRSLFENPTIAGLAQQIEPILWAIPDEARLSSISVTPMSHAPISHPEMELQREEVEL